MTDISAFSLRPGQNFTWNIQGPPLKAPISRKAQWTPELVRQRGWCGWFGQKCFSFEKKFTFILRRYIRLWWLMSIVFKMLLQWHHHHVFHHSGTSRCATKPSLRLALPQFQGSLVVLRFGSHFMQVVTSLAIQHYQILKAWFWLLFSGWYISNYINQASSL